jgi:hypothetical protein
MLHSLKITIENDIISLEDEVGSRPSKRSKLVAVDIQGQIVNLGRPLEELQKIPNTRILDPFTMEPFQVELAATAIQKMAQSATLLRAESSADDSKKLVIMSWDIQFPRYESLTHEVQEAFEYYVQLASQGFKLKRLTINGQPKNIGAFQRATRAIMVGLLVTVIASQFFMTKILQFTVPEQMAKPLTLFQFILSAVAWALFIYVVGFLYVAVCRVFLKNVIPAPVYKKLILGSSLSPEKIAAWLRDKLSFHQNGG